MRLLGVTAIAVAALAVSACATRTVSSHVEFAADFANYRTYDWAAADSLPTGDARLDNNEFFRDYFIGAVDKELAARRIRLITSDPDLLIHTHTNVTRRFEIDRIAREDPACVGRSCIATTVDYEMGTLMIDVLDARTRKLIWRAWARDNMSGVIDDQQRLRRAVTDAVAEMMKRFPK